MWLELLSDIQCGVEPASIASRFHHPLTNVARQLRETHGFGSVALSGGVFQNRLISTRLPIALGSRGFNVLMHNQVPTHDGGLSLGQAAIAAAQLLQKELDR